MNSARDLGRTLCRVRRGSIKVATKKSVTTLGDRSPSRAHLTGRGPQDQAARSPERGPFTPPTSPPGCPRALAVKRPHGRRMTSASRTRGTGRLPQPASRTPFPRGFSDADAGGSGPGTYAREPDEVPAACRVGSGRRLQDRGDGSKTRVSREDSNSGRQVPRLARNQGI